MSKKIHITLTKQIFDVKIDGKNFEVHVEKTEAGQTVSNIFGEQELSDETKAKLEKIVLINLEEKEHLDVILDFLEPTSELYATLSKAINLLK